MDNINCGLWKALQPGHWTPSCEIGERYAVNRRYMLSLETDRLLRHHEMLAGLVRVSDLDLKDYRGWETPNCQLRGHFVGHYLSACAMAWAYHGDGVLKARGEEIVARLRRCQIENGDGWCFSVPREYLQWLERGKPVWAPQYTIHKTLMGLLDMAALADSAAAMEVLRDAADWFRAWTEGKTRSQLDDLLDVETGGMLEVWVEMYGLTRDERYLPLIDRYRRPRVFDAIRQGRDVLTMMHANTTIPEALGYARAYEVLGDTEDLDIVERYWKLAITDRGTFATGGQTYNEVWMPNGKQSEYLGRDNQEHCVMYNLIRLADFLWRHTGEQGYLEYIGRAYANGILAQQNRATGMVAYYLPMLAGAHADWGSEHDHFWCCHGTLVQVHNCEGAFMAYENDEGLLLAQYYDATLRLKDGTLEIAEDRIGTHYAPENEGSGCRAWQHEAGNKILRLHREQATPFSLTLRIPAWVKGEAIVSVSDELPCAAKAGTLFTLRGVWTNAVIQLHFPAEPRVEELPDQPGKGAFMLGEDVLVGCTADDTLRLTIKEACRRLRPMRPGTMRCEPPRYSVNDGTRTVELFRLRDLADETYTMYFVFDTRAEKKESV